MFAVYPSTETGVVEMLGGMGVGVAGQQPSSRTTICSFVEETGLLPEPHKMTFSEQFMSMFLPAMSETDSMAVA